ncbi:phosphoribosylaminoimidazolesuccinocarboxamide synthase, partial [Candidatus Woesearchaeota archaeon]|nr:phosphoribosylaminoimidazolesuccinocarboxamide synthase [Candidatus Woesearchaeota archaeon]
LFKAGKEQRKIDKEYVRSWLADRGFIGEGEIPKIPDEVRTEAARRYIEAFEKITGQEFKADSEDPIKRIEANLDKAGLLKEGK